MELPRGIGPCSVVEHAGAKQGPFLIIEAGGQAETVLVELETKLKAMGLGKRFSLRVYNGALQIRRMNSRPENKPGHWTTLKRKTKIFLYEWNS